MSMENFETKLIPYFMGKKVHSLILASSFYDIRISRFKHKKLKSKLLANSDFALANCVQLRVHM